MKVIISHDAGFCFGVKRALGIASETITNSKEQLPNGFPVYSLGAIIHNPEVVEKLKSEGLGLVDSLDELRNIKKGCLIVRSHGIPPKTRFFAESLGFIIRDATCPNVSRIHKIVRDLSKQGYKILIAGRKNHPEVVGIIGHADGRCKIVESPDDINALELQGKIGLVSQTTFSAGKFSEISAMISERCPDISIFNTICSDTVKRQDGIKKFAGEVDVMVIIGGKESSNTLKLADISRNTGTITFHIESQEEIEEKWFKNAMIVGLTGGASTSVETIKKIKVYIESLEC